MPQAVEVAFMLKTDDTQSVPAEWMDFVYEDLNYISVDADGCSLQLLDQELTAHSSVLTDVYTNNILSIEID